MKSNIQSEAEKAAKKIREALVEFNRVTGFRLKASGGWMPLRATGEFDDDSDSRPRELRVTVRVDGEIEVKA